MFYFVRVGFCSARLCLVMVMLCSTGLGLCCVPLGCDTVMFNVVMVVLRPTVLGLYSVPLVRVVLC